MKYILTLCVILCTCITTDSLGQRPSLQVSPKKDMYVRIGEAKVVAPAIPSAEYNLIKETARAYIFLYQSGSYRVVGILPKKDDNGKSTATRRGHHIVINNNVDASVYRGVIPFETGKLYDVVGDTDTAYQVRFVYKDYAHVCEIPKSEVVNYPYRKPQLINNARSIDNSSKSTDISTFYAHSRGLHSSKQSVKHSMNYKPSVLSGSAGVGYLVPRDEYLDEAYGGIWSTFLAIQTTKARPLSLRLGLDIMWAKADDEYSTQVAGMQLGTEFFGFNLRLSPMWYIVHEPTKNGMWGIYVGAGVTAAFFQEDYGVMYIRSGGKRYRDAADRESNSGDIGYHAFIGIEIAPGFHIELMYEAVTGETENTERELGGALLRAGFAF